MRSITLMVLNYNGASITIAGKPLLDITLPTILTASQSYSGYSEVIVIDNKSTDNSCEHIVHNYPDVKIHKAGGNDFLFSYNAAVEFIDTDLVMLLNNDMCLDEEAITPLTRAFDDTFMFAVGADVFLTTDGAPSTVPDSRCMRVQWYKGRLFPIDASGTIEHGLPVPFYALGGAVVFDTVKFRELGGLDQVFYPYNFEDSDIAFRAFLRGWKTRIAEEARAYHLGSKTIGTIIKRNTARSVFLTNEYIFMWKNIRSRKLLLQTLLWMPWHMMRYRFGGVRVYVRSFLAACAKLLVIKEKRREQFVHCVPGTDEVFFNPDLKGITRDLLWAKVYCAANEPLKGLALVRKLFVVLSSDSDYSIRSLRAVVTDCLVVLFQAKKYRTIIAQERTLPPGMLSVHALYTIASSFREVGDIERAAEIYYRVAENKEADAGMRALAFYHCATIRHRQKKDVEMRELGARCLALMPEHKKCKELLEVGV